MGKTAGNSQQGFDNQNNTISQEHLQKVLSLIKNIKYGSVTLIIHHGQWVQIEVNEKFRLKKN